MREIETDIEIHQVVDICEVAVDTAFAIEVKKIFRTAQIIIL